MFPNKKYLGNIKEHLGRDFLRSDFQKFSNLCAIDLEIYLRESLQFFVSGSGKHILVKATTKIAHMLS